MAHTKQVSHLAVIMDGNGRWAKKRGMSRVEGHAVGAKAAIDLVEACVQRKVQELTLYALSVENMTRDQKEVRFITELLISTLTNKQRSLQENGVRVRVIGNRDLFDQGVQDVISFVEQTTKKNTILNLNIAFNYSGKWQIKKALEHANRQSSESDEKLFQHFEDYLKRDINSDPDLLIRTGGEKRLSNFMLWHLAYTELFFSDIMWPDFSSDSLDDILDAYHQRERRFGQVAGESQTSMKEAG